MATWLERVCPKCAEPLAKPSGKPADRDKRVCPGCGWKGTVDQATEVTRERHKTMEIVEDVSEETPA